MHSIQKVNPIIHVFCVFLTFFNNFAFVQVYDICNLSSYILDVNRLLLIIVYPDNSYAVQVHRLMTSIP